MDTIIVEIPKSQLAILAQKVATIVEQGGKYYSMNVMEFSTLAPNQRRDSRGYKINLNG